MTDAGAVPTLAAPAADELSPARLRELYHALLLPRVIEEKMLLLLRQGRLSKWFSGMGQEAIAVGVTAALEPDDPILPMHRNLGVFTTRGVDLARLLRQLLGRTGGFTKGRDRTFHFGFLEQHLVGMISHLGAMLPVADGLALASQLRGTRRVAAAFTGDGATSEGDFHEAVNLAAVWKLPVLFVVENNQYGLSTPTHEQYACADLAERGAGYGIPGVVIDGNDVVAVYRAVRTAAARARRGEGPTLIEFKTFRMRGHEEASGVDYVPRALIEEWGRKDPLLRFERLLVERGLLDDGERDALRAETKARIDALVDDALAVPEPVSTAAAELGDVYAPSRLRPSPPDALALASAPERRYVDAIRDALHVALTRDERVLLMGQDIAEYGGVFKCTEGFVEEFGKARVRNTPIVESGAVGAALGLALGGFVPMVEMQFGDFITCGFNQIVNNLAKTHYRWGAGVPVVLRVPVGGGVGAGPFHSQNVEAWFTCVAGLKVLAPSTPFDAKGLLLAAFEDGNPVLFLEHKFLYRWAKGRVPEGHYTLPLGRADVLRRGRDATVASYGVGVHWALDAAARLAEEGHEIEVIDLRTLLPWDVETVVASVRRTGRALVLHEAPLTGGFGAEVAATLGRAAFEWLDAPVARLGALDTPVPFSRALEAVFSPKDQVVPALRELLAY
jgi:2-oxoisovalerate dehydrogenase E1 component